MEQRSKRTWWLGIAVLASLAVVAWLVGSLVTRAQPERDAEERATSSTTRASERAELASDAQLAVERREVEQPRDDRVPETSGPLAGAATPVTDTRPPTPFGLIAIEGRFETSEGKGITVPRAHVELRGEDDVVHAADVANAESVTFADLHPGRWSVRVEAEGFVHREQTLDVLAPDGTGRRSGSEHRVRASAESDARTTVSERLVLWPDGWIAVIVETPDGRPFAELATELGADPMQLFVGAFGARARDEAPTDADDAPSASFLVEFHPPPKYKTWEVVRACVGSLELHERPTRWPIWIGLEVYGRVHAWAPLELGAREIRFVIDRDALDARFASVRLRALDATTRAPIAGARVTLRADRSANRRPDLTGVPTRDDGRVELVHVVPGRYELLVERGEAQHQAMLELRAGERRDAGDVLVADGRGVDVRVVDESGKPVEAYIEIGTLRANVRSNELYPPMIRHQSGKDGRVRLPLPTEVSIARASKDLGRSNGASSTQEVRGARSADVLIDPRALPSGPIELVIERDVRVRVEGSRADGARIEVLDELDVVVARATSERPSVLDAELVPGRYRARTIDADGVAGPGTRFEVERAAVDASSTPPLVVRVD